MAVRCPPSVFISTHRTINCLPYSICTRLSGLLLSSSNNRSGGDNNRTCNTCVFSSSSHSPSASLGRERCTACTPLCIGSPALLLASVYAVNASLVPFYTMMLKDLGFSWLEVGSIVSCTKLFGMVSGPLWCAVADQMVGSLSQRRSRDANVFSQEACPISTKACRIQAEVCENGGGEGVDGLLTIKADEKDKDTTEKRREGKDRRQSLVASSSRVYRLLLGLLAAIGSALVVILLGFIVKHTATLQASHDLTGPSSPFSYSSPSSSSPSPSPLPSPPFAVVLVLLTLYALFTSPKSALVDTIVLAESSNENSREHSSAECNEERKEDENESEGPTCHIRGCATRHGNMDLSETVTEEREGNEKGISIKTIHKDTALCTVHVGATDVMAAHRADAEALPKGSNSIALVSMHADETQPAHSVSLSQSFAPSTSKGGAAEKRVVRREEHERYSSSSSSSSYPLHRLWGSAAWGIVSLLVGIALKWASKRNSGDNDDGTAVVGSRERVGSSSSSLYSSSMIILSIHGASLAFLAFVLVSGVAAVPAASEVTVEREKRRNAEDEGVTEEEKYTKGGEEVFRDPFLSSDKIRRAETNEELRGDRDSHNGNDRKSTSTHCEAMRRVRLTASFLPLAGSPQSSRAYFATSAPPLTTCISPSQRSSASVSPVASERSSSAATTPSFRAHVHPLTGILSEKSKDERPLLVATGQGHNFFRSAAEGAHKGLEETERAAGKDHAHDMRGHHLTPASGSDENIDTNGDNTLGRRRWGHQLRIRVLRIRKSLCLPLSKIPITLLNSWARLLVILRSVYQQYKDIYRRPEVTVPIIGGVAVIGLAESIVGNIYFVYLKETFRVDPLLFSYMLCVNSLCEMGGFVLASRLLTRRAHQLTSDEKKAYSVNSWGGETAGVDLQTSPPRSPLAHRFRNFLCACLSPPLPTIAAVAYILKLVIYMYLTANPFSSSSLSITTQAGGGEEGKEEHTPWWVLVAEPLHGIFFSFLWSSSVAHLNEVWRDESGSDGLGGGGKALKAPAAAALATLWMWYGSVPSVVGGIVSSALMQYFGASGTLATACCIAAIGGAVLHVCSVHGLWKQPRR